MAITGKTGLRPAGKYNVNSVTVPVTIPQGGTGSTSASAARTALGVAIGTNVEAWDATLDALASYNTNGIMTQTAADVFTGRTITGTTNVITVTNGSGVSGNPTITIAATYVGQTSITTLGTITSGTWAGTTIAVSNGGTGQSSYTNGQLLIGNTTGNTLTKNTLTAGTGISISNGSGTITISNTGVTTAIVDPIAVSYFGAL